MKWDNTAELKNTRRSEWYTSPPPPRDMINEAGKWCREHDSDGRFYNHYTNTRWWFEKEEDAIWFRLRFSK